MREAGFSPEPLGTNLETANARARQLNAEWDQIRAAPAPLQEIELGTFTDLFARFQKDPTFYKSKKPRTQEGIDRAFRYALEVLGSAARVRDFLPRHGRALYNRLHEQRGAHVAYDTMKWVRRAMRYAKEIGWIDHNPLYEFTMDEPAARKRTLTEADVDAIVNEALRPAYKHAHAGTWIKPRPDLAIATSLAYDFAQQQCDILRLTLALYDGTAFVIEQQKKRGDRRLYLPVSHRSQRLIQEYVIDPLNTGNVTSIADPADVYIVTDPKTGAHFVDPPDRRNQSRRMAFSRAWGKLRDRAGVDSGKWFADLRRTVLTELGNRGGTEAEIVALSGHQMGSPVIRRYVIPGEAAAKSAARKRNKKD